MKKSKTTNRNLWSNNEDTILLECASSEGTLTAAMKRASAKLGRTYGACMFRYYQRVDSRKEKSTTVKRSPRKFEFNIKSYSIKNGKLIVTI